MKDEIILDKIKEKVELSESMTDITTLVEVVQVLSPINLV